MRNQRSASFDLDRDRISPNWHHRFISHRVLHFQVLLLQGKIFLELRIGAE
jgi:hypothetical protein